jgi:hypothetical protein
LLKAALIFVPIFVHPYFSKAFVLYVDWSMHAMGGHGHIIIEKNEWVVAYASKGLSLVQKKFHPMEDVCYALV